MSREAEIVEWLRDVARRAQSKADMHPGRYVSNKSDGPNYCSESEYATKFADEIERRFVEPSQLKQLVDPPGGTPTYKGQLYPTKKKKKKLRKYRSGRD